MNQKILKIVLGRKEEFVPLIFTDRQFSVLEKYERKVKLLNAEKKALYTSIKKKMDALESFLLEQRENEYYISSANKILPNRLSEAKKILDEYSKKYQKVFVSGSFLFSKEFKDIDIFIVRRRGYKEKWDGKKHIIFLSEKRLAKPVFQSTSLISVSNFIIPREIKKKNPSLSQAMGTYHEAVIEFMRKEEKHEAIRNLVFDYHLLCKNNLIDGKELKEFSERVKLNDLDTMINYLCKKLFSETYLYVEVHTYIKTLKESIKNIKPNTHLMRFRNTYEEMIYGRSKATVA